MFKAWRQKRLERAIAVARVRSDLLIQADRDSGVSLYYRNRYIEACCRVAYLENKLDSTRQKIPEYQRVV